MKMASEAMLFQSNPTLDTASGGGVTVTFGVDPPFHNDVNVGLHVRSTPPIHHVYQVIFVLSKYNTMAHFFTQKNAR